MIVTVKLFAAARQLMEAETLTIELDAGSTVGGLRQKLRDEAPSLGPLLPHVMIAVNMQYAQDDVTLQPNDEVALIPPVSGG